MDLQTLVRLFEEAMQAQRLLRLGHLEDGNYADIKEAAKLSGHCGGIKQGLSIFGDVIRNLLSNNPNPNVTAVPATDSNPPVED